MIRPDHTLGKSPEVWSGMIRPSRGKMICKKLKSKMGKSATKMTISINRHREIQHFDGYCYKMGKSAAVKKWSAKNWRAKCAKYQPGNWQFPPQKKWSVRNSKAKCAKYQPEKMICKKLKTNFRSGGEVPENIEIETWRLSSTPIIFQNK